LNFERRDLELTLFLPSRSTGLISQVAEEIWEVKGKKIINLSKEGMTIVDYKVRSPSPLDSTRPFSLSRR